MKDEQEMEAAGVDLNKVSAFAMYKNLIPGLKVFQDTNSPTNSPKLIKSRKRKRKQKARKDTTPKEENNLPNKSNVTTTTKNEAADKVPQHGTSTNGSMSEMQSNEHENEVISPEVESDDELPVSITSDLPEPLLKKSRAAFTVPPLISPLRVKQIAKSHKAMRMTLGIKKFKKTRNLRKVADSNCLEATSPQENGNQSNWVKKKSASAATSSVQDDSSPTPAKSSAQLISLDSLLCSTPIEDSIEHGKSLFKWLIHPTPIKKFFTEHWEQKPLYVKRLTQRDYYSWIMSSSTLDEILRKNVIKFGKNIDVTSYVDGVRQTHNPEEGRAYPAVVWDYYSEGNSIRFLNPQTYIKPLWRLNASLQEYLGTFVGANVYLTPPDSQGFAPHYDDIEAFVIQIEGFKHWKLYKPRTIEETLPRFSSPNFNEEKDNLGDPILDVILGPGDLLYFPRGFIHQAKAAGGEHSLHITISAYQTNTYADFMKIYLPLALEQSISESLELRKGLPRDYLSYMGVVHSDRKQKRIVEQREAFQAKIKHLATRILNKSCDLAADQLGKKMVWDSLPPYFTSQEIRQSVHGDGEFLRDGSVLNRAEIGPEVEVRLIRKHACRLVIEEDTLRLYFNLENSLEYHGEDPQYLELPDSAGALIEHLCKQYPEFTKIEDLPMEDEALKVQLAADLWEKGILVTSESISADPVDDVTCRDYSDKEGSIGSEDRFDILDKGDDVFSNSDFEEEVEDEEDEEDRSFINDGTTDEDSDVDTSPVPRFVQPKRWNSEKSRFI